MLYDSVCLSTVTALAATIKSRQGRRKRGCWGCSEVSGTGGAAVCRVATGSQILTGIQTKAFSSKGFGLLVNPWVSRLSYGPAGERAPYMKSQGESSFHVYEREQLRRAW